MKVLLVTAPLQGAGTEDSLPYNFVLEFQRNSCDFVATLLHTKVKHKL